MPANLDAAQNIAACDGWQTLTARKVTERIDYSHPTIY